MTAKAKKKLSGWVTVVLILVMLFTWSPKAKEISSVVTDKVKSVFKKKEAGTNE